MKRPTTMWPCSAWALLSCVAVACITGCATPPITPRTTVVLLPDEDGNVGAVLVNTPAGSQILDRAFTASTVGSASIAPSAAQALGSERVDADYRALLKAQPPKPATFTLNFLLDKSLLTEESKAQVPAMLEAVRARKPTEITIFGHTDSTGTEERNFKLAAERAKVVADLLKKHDPALDRIEIQSFGDKQPLVPSKPRAAEPRNRRAEVQIL